jgi:hypothetical protein
MKTKIAALLILMVSFKVSFANVSKPCLSKKAEHFFLQNSCLTQALNQVSAASNYYYAQMHECNMSPGPTSGCAQAYIDHCNAAYAIIEANYNSCTGGGNALTTDHPTDGPLSQATKIK